jgi:hypothetical protein
MDCYIGGSFRAAANPLMAMSAYGCACLFSNRTN